MNQSKLVKSNYSQSIATEEYQLDLSRTIIEQTIKSTNRFSFIALNQWILLLILNSICLGFIVFVCFWLD